MTRKEARDTEEMLRRLERIGISYHDANDLRRISMTLHRWYELECGVDNGCVERDETTKKTYWLNGSSDRRYPTPDRETGALKRLAAIMARYPTLTSYVQGDPRGAALYILRPEDMIPDASIDSFYSRGVAVYKVNAVKQEALRILRNCGVRAGEDFHTLSTDQVHSLLVEADLMKYRKPKNANGSRGRYFHAMLQRRATRKESCDAFDSDWPSLLSDVNADLSDALELIGQTDYAHMSKSNKDRIGKIRIILQGSADAVREAPGGMEEQEDWDRV